MEKSELQQPYKCSECGRAVLNRRYPKCEFCGTDLPEEFKLTDKEIEASNKSMKEARGYKERQDGSDQYDLDSTNWTWSGGFGGDGCDGGD